MPLYQDAAENIREQLDRIRLGHRVPLIAIGYLTEAQHTALREFRASQNLAGGESPEIVYLGRHHFNSRSAQGYTVEDMVLQIQAGLAADAAPFLRGAMTSLWAVSERDDGYGKRVRDQAIFEMTSRKPRVELYSVIPKGDGR